MNSNENHRLMVSSGYTKNIIRLYLFYTKISEHISFIRSSLHVTMLVFSLKKKNRAEFIIGIVNIFFRLSMS